MMIYNSFEEMPEISDGQVAHLKIDGGNTICFFQGAKERLV